MRAGWAGAVLAAGLALISPSVAASPILAHPLAEILVGDPELTMLGTDSVSVEISTSIPVVCAVVYGETTAYGQLATDTAMAAEGHRDHTPRINGLKPDTTYQMRMQGIGPDGTIYVGENMTFRTASSASAVNSIRPSGRNIASRSIVSAVSSNYGGGGLASTYGGNNAVDGKLDTEWSSDGDGDHAWIEIDLGQESQISAIGLKTRTMGSSAQIKRFQVVTDKGDRLGPFTVPDALSVHYFEVSSQAQKLRFEVLESSGGNTGIGELEIYAP